MVIDIHSHVSLLGLFIVGNSYDDVYRFERHVVFPKIMVGGCQFDDCVFQNGLILSNLKCQVVGICKMMFI